MRSPTWTTRGKWLALVVAAGLIPVSAQAQDKAASALEARVKKAAADAQALVKARFPSQAEMGKGWLTAWQIPENLFLPSPNARRISEEEFQMRQLGVWLMLQGMSEGELKAMLDPSFAKELEEATKRGDKLLPTKELAFRLFMMQVRSFTMPAFQSPMVATAQGYQQMIAQIERMAEVDKQVQAARSAHAKEVEALAARDLKPEVYNAMVKDLSKTLDEKIAQIRGQSEAAIAEGIFSVMLPDLKGKSYDEMVRVCVGEIGSIRQAADMLYLHCAPDQIAKATKEPGYVPPFGTITVQLRVLTRDAIKTRIKDWSEKDLTETAKVLEGIFNKVLQQMQKGDSKSPIAGTVKVTFEKKKFGDNSWILFIEGPKAPGGMQINFYYARLRNGNAVVNFEGTGTYDREWFAKNLDFFLTAAID